MISRNRNFLNREYTYGNLEIHERWNQPSDKHQQGVKIGPAKSDVRQKYLPKCMKFPDIS